MNKETKLPVEKYFYHDVTIPTQLLSFVIKNIIFFDNKWIRQYISWPFSSSDSTIMDFYLWELLEENSIK